MGSVYKGQPRWKSSGVDWKAYSEAIENTVKLMEYKENYGILEFRKNLKQLSEEFQTTIINAAKKHVGKTKPGKGKVSWVTPAVRDAIKKRNKLRKNVSNNRKEWLDACQEARMAINHAKEEAWRGVLEDSSTTGDDRKLWRVIKSLNGTPENNSPNEAMIHNDRCITSDKRKADIFIKHYAGVSKIDMSKEDRTENRNLKISLRELRGQNSSVPEFTEDELREALNNMRPKGAPGPDDISPPLLKNLGPYAIKLLLHIFNLSLTTGNIPQVWRNANIIPLLKANKPPSDLGSFRPISLTSCVGKLLERMISARMYSICERNGWISGQQAGFRKGRGVEDQIIRVAQAVSDGFQSRQRSVMALLDFSKAYDTVWRQRLLNTLIGKGLNNRYVLWLSSFLENRQARVRFNGSISRSRKIHQGLPQGSVLAPLLFVLYIDGLNKMPEMSGKHWTDPSRDEKSRKLHSKAGRRHQANPTNIAEVTTAMYADDVSILATANSLTQAQKALQNAVSAVDNWSNKWKLNLNSTKSESTFFTLSNAELDWKPSIKIGEKIVPFNRTPKFLGVTFDRLLSFKPHVEETVRKAERKMSLIRAVANTSWGSRKKNLKKV